MALIYNIERDIRYNQGPEKGLKEAEKATNERNTAFVTYLLQNTTHSVEQIAGLVNVPVEFVMKIKETLLQ